VTKPGLGLEVGKAAINPVPRQMITQAVQEIAGEALARQGVNVVISVPAGEELAKKTLNPRLGIIGGISILGTTGIVVPYSTSAYRAAIAQALDVAVANECEHVVLTTGGRTERFAQQMLPHLAEEAFVQIGEFLGFALKECQRRNISKVTFCGMIGKFSKVAAGASCLHVKNSQVDMNFLAELAAECGASEELVANIKKANTARHVSELVIEHGLPELHTRICERVYQHCMQVLQDATELECVLVGFVGDVLARVTHES
jgi:cobalt-precorrin-5B (C1)-methyltransferase